MQMKKARQGDNGAVFCSSCHETPFSRYHPPDTPYINMSSAIRPKRLLHDSQLFLSILVAHVILSSPSIISFLSFLNYTPLSLLLQPNSPSFLTISPTFPHLNSLPLLPLLPSTSSVPPPFIYSHFLYSYSHRFSYIPHK